jgi:glycosyltransferase involved in cell wall biosynthesis
MVAPDAVSGRPVVSVIVPARNEEACLGACLESLVSQTGVNFEIIVADDASTDRTRQIAQSFAGVCVIDAGPLPEGWTGKNNAMAAGAKQARGEWLLFTDADTVHRPGSLARALAEANQHGVALLSYSPEQQVHGVWEKVVMPVIFAELAAVYPPTKVNDPGSSIAAANGQYLLISREAYDGVGGHAKIAGDLLEDVALARLLKGSGRRIFFRFGGDVVRTRMYRSFVQLKEGWTKNLALLFPHPLALACFRGAEFVLIGSLLAAAVTLWLRRPDLALLMGSLALTVMVSFWLRIRRSHFRPLANAVAVFGLPVFSYLLLRSRSFHRRNMVCWKGRQYRGARSDTAIPVIDKIVGSNIVV